MKKYASVEEYIDDQTPEFGRALRHVRSVLKKAFPEAKEGLSYGMPAFFAPKAFVAYAAFKNHCSLFPMSGSILPEFEPEIKEFEFTKGTLHFTPDHMIPDDLIIKIAQARLDRQKK